MFEVRTLSGYGMQGTPVRYAGYTGTVRRVHWYGTQGALVRYAGCMGTTFEVQKGNWVQRSRYACCLGVARKVHACKMHGCGMQGTCVRCARYTVAVCKVHS